MSPSSLNIQASLWNSVNSLWILAAPKHLHIRCVAAETMIHHHVVAIMAVIHPWAAILVYHNQDVALTWLIPAPGLQSRVARTPITRDQDAAAAHIQTGTADILQVVSLTLLRVGARRRSTAIIIDVERRSMGPLKIRVNDENLCAVS